jgi:predicted lipid-binding transport protein (Tim44 family)
MRERLVQVACALALAVAVGGCSADDDPPAPVASPTSTSARAVPASTTASSTVATTTPTTTAIPGGCPSGVGAAAQNAEQAARCLFQSWERNDRTAAAAFASLDVVDVLFRDRWSAPAGTFAGCATQPASDGQTCTVEHRGTRYQFDVRRSEGGWRVTQLRRGG